MFGGNYSELWKMKKVGMQPTSSGLLAGTGIGPSLLCSVMNKDDQYRKQAAQAQAMADLAGGASDKAAWLKIAQGWLSMIRKPRQTATEKFDDQVKAQGTNQGDDSKESH
jgi:hypothetical protein